MSEAKPIAIAIASAVDGDGSESGLAHDSIKVFLSLGEK